MSESWRRATELPSYATPHSYYGTTMHVALPPYLADAASPPSFGSRGLNNSYAAQPSVSPPNPVNMSREQVMYDYEEARRSYTTILQRERAELDQAKHEVDALSHEKLSLRRELSDAENRASVAARERDIANARLVSESAGLRADCSRLQNEATTLKTQLQATHEQLTGAMKERSQLETLVSNLKADLVASGKLIADQASTIRALSGEMSRRDPYHLVKEKRERGDELQLANHAVTVATLEDRIKFLESKLAADKQAFEKSLEAERKALVDRSQLSPEAEAAYKKRVTTLELEVTTLKREKDTIMQHAMEAAAEADKLAKDLKKQQDQSASDRLLREDLVKEVETLRKKSTPASAPPPSMPLKSTMSDTERQEYDAAFLALRQDSEDLKAHVRACHALLERIETGVAVADVKQCKVVAATLTLESASGLLERDPKNKGLQDPFVRVYDTLGDKVLETVPSAPTNDPEFNRSRDKCVLHVTKGSRGVVKVEVFSKGVGADSAFLGCAIIPVKTMLEGSGGKLTLPLTTRENEADAVVLAAKDLGRITLSIVLTAAGAAPVAAKAATPSLPSVSNLPPSSIQPTNGPVGTATAVVTGAATIAPAPAQRAEVNSGGPQFPQQPVVNGAPAVPVPVVAARSQPKVIVPTEVIFHIDSVKGVMCRDPFGSKSDPYVKITRPGKPQPQELFRTSIMQDAIDATWPKNEKSMKTLLIDPTDKLPYIFEVWDDDQPRSDDFLGQAVLDVSAILSGTGLREMKLRPRDDEPDEDIKKHGDSLGFVCVNITVLGPGAAVSTEKKPAGLDATAAAPVPAGKGPSPAVPVAPVAPTALPTVQEIAAVATGPAQKFVIQVVEASGLLSHRFSKTDPYVIVHNLLGEEVLVTEICNNTTTPKWKIDTSCAEVLVTPTDTSFVTFDVLDDERVLGIIGPKPKYLGFAKLSGNQILAAHESELRLKLTPRDNESEDEVKENANNLGVLTVRITRVYSAPASASASAPSAPTVNSAGGVGPSPAPNAAPAVTVRASDAVDDVREVVVTVCSIKGVMGRNLWGGVSDPYCIITAPGSKPFHTPVRDDCVSATWTDAEGTIKAQLSPNQAGSVTIEVMDKNKGIGSDNFLGFVDIPIPEVFALNGKAPKTYKLVMKPGVKDSAASEQLQKGGLGEVTVKASVSGMSSGRLSTMLAAPIAQRVAPPSTTAPFPVRVWVKGCQGLMNRQPNGEITDPFVVTRGPRGEERSTPTQDNNLNPQWNIVDGSSKMTINPTDPGFLVFDVMDVGQKTGQLRLGSAELAVQDLIRDGLGERIFKLSPGWKEPDPEIIKNKDNLGTLTVLITVDDGAAPPSGDKPAQPVPTQAAAVEAQSVEPRPYTLQVINGEGLVKRRPVPTPQIEVRNSAQKLVLSTKPARTATTDPMWIAEDVAQSVVMLTPADASDMMFYIFTEAPSGRLPMGVAKLSVRSAIAAAATKPRWELPVQLLPTENDPFLLNNKDSLGKIVVEVRPGGATASSVPQKPPGPAPAAATAAQVVPAATIPVAASSATAPNAPRPVPLPTAEKVAVSILIKSGKDMLKMDFMTSDPLVKLFRNDEMVFQTAVKSSTLNPVWNQSAPIVNLVRGSSDKLTFQVLDEDNDGLFGNKKKYEDMGSAVLSADEALALLDKGDTELPVRLGNQDRGKLVVEFKRV